MNHLTESIKNFIRLCKMPGENNRDLVIRVCEDPVLFSKIVSIDNHLYRNPTMLREIILQEEFIITI